MKLRSPYWVYCLSLIKWRGLTNPPMPTFMPTVRHAPSIWMYLKFMQIGKPFWVEWIWLVRVKFHGIRGAIQIWDTVDVLKCCHKAAAYPGLIWRFCLYFLNINLVVSGRSVSPQVAVVKDPLKCDRNLSDAIAIVVKLWGPEKDYLVVHPT